MRSRIVCPHPTPDCGTNRNADHRSHRRTNFSNACTHYHPNWCTHSTPDFVPNSDTNICANVCANDHASNNGTNVCANLCANRHSHCRSNQIAV